jgi:hypothetical protein
MIAPLIDFPNPIEPPSTLERACWFVPVIGWITANLLSLERLKPKTQYIVDQLTARTPAALEAWGDDPNRRAVATAVCEAIQRECVWPNPYYIREDPLIVLFWRCDHEREILFALVDIERRLGVDAVQYVPLPLLHRSLGQLVDFIATLPRKPTVEKGRQSHPFMLEHPPQ